MKTLLLYAVCACIAFNSWKAEGATRDRFGISGKILDENQAPVEFATVLLLHAADSSLVKGEMTNEQGLFEFSDVAAGSYRLQISSLGFLPSDRLVHVTDEVNLGAITLQNRSNQLDEVVVQANAPLIRRENDKIIVDVETSSVLAGGNALEALQKAPGVLVDQDGHISLRGKQGVLVMIDDKPTYLTPEQLANQLRAMPSDAISRIEVITNPSARYDAEGNAGIINIVTKKSKASGFNASVDAGTRYWNFWSPSGGVNMNYRKDNVNLFGSYNYATYNRLQTLDIRRNFNSEPVSTVYEYSTLEHHDRDHTYKAGMDYFLNENHTLGFVVNGFMNDYEVLNHTNVDIVNADGSFTPPSHTFGDLDGFMNNTSFNLNYDGKLDTLGTTLSADADYACFQGSGDDMYTNTYYDESGNPEGNPVLYNTLSPGTISIRSLKADVNHPFRNKLNLEAGLKASTVRNDNEEIFLVDESGEWETDSSKTNHFIYDESVYAGYLQFSRQFGSIGAQAGLRGEYTAADGNSETSGELFSRRYFQLFPTLSVGNEFSDKHQLTASYSRRIDRPEYDQLNPFLFFLDPYLYQKGNPNLEPQLTHSLELNYLLDQTYSVSFSYSSTQDQIEELFYQTDSSRTIILMPDNFGNNTTYSLTAYAPLQPFKWWSITPVVTAFYQDLKTDYEGEPYHATQFGYNINVQNDFQLPKGFSLELSGWYQSPVLFSIASIEGFGEVSLGLKKSFDDDRGTLKFGFRDMFNTNTIAGDIQFSNIDSYFRQHNDNRQLALTFSYRFGSGPGSERQRDNSIEAEKNRVNKN